MAKNRSSKFTSFEFLNFGARKNDKNKDGSVPQRPHTASAAAKRSKEEDGSRIRAKALGLGPVKVVLKWHGTSRFNGLKSKRLPAKSAGEKKSAARKRVIVYSNPTTTTGAMTADAAELASKHAKADHDPIKSKANKAAAESSKVDLKLLPRNGTKASANIITNPLDEANQVDHRLHPHHQANGADDGAFRSRRFSMQERASHPPNLSRNLSEMHRPPAHSKSNSSASVALATRPSDQKRNRHSWASSRPSVELNGGHSVEHINIDMDSEDCSQWKYLHSVNWNVSRPSIPFFPVWRDCLIPQVFPPQNRKRNRAVDARPFRKNILSLLDDQSGCIRGLEVKGAQSPRFTPF